MFGLIHAAQTVHRAVDRLNRRRGGLSTASAAGVWALAALIILGACMPNPLPDPTAAPTRDARPTPLPTQLRNIGQNNPTAAAVPSGGALPPLDIPGQTSVSGAQSVQIPAADGTLLLGDLYLHPGGQRVPGVLLLAADRGAWLDLPLRLQNGGFTALSVAVRVIDGVVPLGDVIALLDSLAEVATVDPGRVAVIGGGVGADAALAGCASDLRCDALALFGVTEAANAVAILGYNPRSLFIAHAVDDPALAVSGQIRADARGEVRYEEVSGAATGPGLIQRQPTLIDDLLAWLAAVLTA